MVSGLAGYGKAGLVSGLAGYGKAGLVSGLSRITGQKKAGTENQSGFARIVSQ
jgi:hypothetical protein